MNATPKFLDNEKQIINEAYVLKKIKLEQKIKNPNYRQHKEKGVIRQNTFKFDQPISTLGLRMAVEEQEILIHNVLV